MGSLFSIFPMRFCIFTLRISKAANKSSSQSKETLNGKRKREERLLYLPDGCFVASD